MMLAKLAASQRLSCLSLDSAAPVKSRAEVHAGVSGTKAVAVAPGAAAALPRASPCCLHASPAPKEEGPPCH